MINKKLYLSAPESTALTPPDFNLISWVEANRELDRKSSAEVGLKKVSRTPYLKSLYEWFTDDKIKEINIQKPAQIGITDWVVDCILWTAVNDPSPTALFLADQDTARKIMRFRIKPALKVLGLIERKAKNTEQDVSKFEVNLTNGFYLAIAWGSSISQTASMSFKRVFCDEVNKPGYQVIGTEGATLGRIKERMETFGDMKFVKLSTPTLDDGTITQLLDSSDVIYDFCCPCPYCGEFVKMEFKNVVWEGGEGATRQQLAKTTGYQCPSCSEVWSEKERQHAVSLGEAIARTDTTGEVVGYQLHRLASLFKGGNMARMVYEFMKAQKDPLELQNVVNSVFGEPWVPIVGNNRTESQQLLSNCKGINNKLELPSADILCLIAGVDVQQSGFWYRIRAVCADGTSYGIDYGFVHSWEELEYIIFERDIAGHKIWRLLIDTGGGKEKGSIISRTEEVYLWIRKNTGRGCEIHGCKGSSGAMTTKVKIGQTIDKTPSGKPLRGGLKLAQINTGAVKDALWYAIERCNESPELPGNWFIEANADESYIKQVTAEEKRRDRKKGGTKWVPIRKDNHLLDCECLCLVAVDPEFYGGTRGLIAKKRTKKFIENRKQASKPKVKRSNPYAEGIY